MNTFILIAQFLKKNLHMYPWYVWFYESELFQIMAITCIRMWVFPPIFVMHRMKQLTACPMLYTCHSGITGKYIIPILMNSEVKKSNWNIWSKYSCKSTCISKILYEEICTIKRASNQTFCYKWCIDSVHI